MIDVLDQEEKFTQERKGEKEEAGAGWCRRYEGVQEGREAAAAALNQGERRK